MSLSPQLMKAILAMDSHCRGYNLAIDLRPRNPDGSVVTEFINGVNQPISSEKIGTQIGNATLTATSTLAFGQGVDRNIGFYASAYSYLITHKPQPI